MPAMCVSQKLVESRAALFLFAPEIPTSTYSQSDTRTYNLRLTAVDVI
jgi:hypothetical protein